MYLNPSHAADPPPPYLAFAPRRTAHGPAPLLTLAAAEHATRAHLVYFCTQVHERMLECYVKARDRFLKPGGKMLPTIGEIVAAPITDETLHQEQGLKASFWESQSYYGVDLSM